jgi:UDP-N-acetylglucosamine 3-dehydrogenase
MKVAVLGTGFGAYHVELLKKIETVDAICVFGRNPEKLAALNQKFGVAVTTDIETIWADADIDLVDVCLPNTLHRQYVIAALERGKHVYCETPFAINREDAGQMLAAANRCGKKVCVDLFVRFQPPYTYLYEKQAAQAYGRLKSLRIYRKTPPIWGDLGRETIVPNLMIHDIDYITWLCGKPRGVQSHIVNGQPGQCAVVGLLQYEDCFVEVTGVSMMPMSSPFAVGYEAIFEKAVIQYREDSFKDREVSSLEVFTAEGIEKVDLRRENCYEKAIRHVVDCILHDTEPINGIEAAGVSLEVAFELAE